MGATEAEDARGAAIMRLLLLVLRLLGSQQPAAAPPAAAVAVTVASSDATASTVNSVRTSSIELMSLSSLWGRDGEAWGPRGPLNDYSFAGYHQGNDPLPSPPVSRDVLSFKEGGMSDTEVFQAALKWANKQPHTDEFIVLSIPAGTFTITEPLFITRDRVVLRGSGSSGPDATVLYVPQSLTDLYGKSSTTWTGGYMQSGAFLTCKGVDDFGPPLAFVTEEAERGDFAVHVNSTDDLKVGEYFVTQWTDINGLFHKSMFDNKVEAPVEYRNEARVKFVSKILGIKGDKVTLERPLPYNLRRAGVLVEFYSRPAYVSECGIEHLAFSFKWEQYAGHDRERGWSAIEFNYAQDSWARDIRTTNADNTVVMNYAIAVTVTGVWVDVTESRANYDVKEGDFDGHWGLHHAWAYDVLAEDFFIQSRLVHSVGAGSSGMFGVYMNGRAEDGSVDLHRALAGPTLFANIDLGVGSRGLKSGGRDTHGPNTQVGTTFWNIKSETDMDPPSSDGKMGDCEVYGPVVHLVNVRLNYKAEHMCATWLNEPSVAIPENLYEAQRALRLRQQR